MKEMRIFTSEQFGEVRVVDIDGQPWWVAKDVCEVLGLDNPTRAISSLDEDEKSTLQISKGGPQRNIINEPGLYSLILRSRKPEAKTFKRWITHEVIPAIRQTGEYHRIPKTMSEALRLAADQAEQLEQQRPLVEAATTLLHTPHTETMSITDAAKHVGLKPQKEAIAYLKHVGFLTQRMKPSQYAIDMGLLVEKTTFDRRGEPHIAAAVPFSALERWRQYLVPRVHAWRMEGVA